MGGLNNSIFWVLQRLAYRIVSSNFQCLAEGLHQSLDILEIFPGHQMTGFDEEYKIRSSQVTVGDSGDLGENIKKTGKEEPCHAAAESSLWSRRWEV